MYKTKKILIMIAVIILILIGIYVSFNNAKETSAKNSLSIQKNEDIMENIFNNKKENLIVENTVALDNEVTEDIVSEKKDEEEKIEETTDNKKQENTNTTVSKVNSTNKSTQETSEKAVIEKLPNYQEVIYGSSENGRDLVYYSISPDNYQDTFLFVFAIHGYEDGYDKDAQVLVNTAKYLVDYYKNKDASFLHDNRLLIVECANPDGLYEGTSNNGFGRCNAKGIDLNRDFDIIHKAFTSSRNYTPAPFSGKESKALADLINKENPVVVIDFHGWENCTIGDGNLAKIFKENMSLSHKTEFNNNCNGYFSYWAHSQGASALLVEFKNDNISKSNLRTAIDEILEEF